MFISLEYRYCKNPNWIPTDEERVLIVKDLDVETDEDVDALVRMGLLNELINDRILGPDAWGEFPNIPVVHPRFIEHGDAIKDIYSGTVWTRGCSGNKTRLVEKSAEVGGRLPTIEELSTIIHRGRSWPASDFPLVDGKWSKEYSEGLEFMPSGAVPSGPGRFVSSTPVAVHGWGEIFWGVDVYLGSIVPMSHYLEDFQAFFVIPTK